MHVFSAVGVTLQLTHCDFVKPEVKDSTYPRTYQSNTTSSFCFAIPHHLSRLLPTVESVKLAITNRIERIQQELACFKTLLLLA